MGYQPGKEFRSILEFVLVSTLDGEFIDSNEARLKILKKFPLLAENS